jgi:ElaB/YqjD/DUF883 family membrane-anchored ribosome-binding protein
MTASGLHSSIDRCAALLRTRFPGAGDPSAQPRPPVCPRDQRCNRGGMLLACSLLTLLDDVKAFVHEEIGTSEFDLLTRFGIDPQPLINLNPPSSSLTNAVRSIFAREHKELRTCFQLLVDDLKAIHRERMFGQATPGKMAYVREVTGTPLSRLEAQTLADRLVSLRERTLMLLGRRGDRLPVSHPKRESAFAMAERIRCHVTTYDVLFFHLRALCANHPSRAVGFDSFCDLYRDEIVQELGTILRDEGVEPPWLQQMAFVRGRGLEARYARRDRSFLSLGDEYGDCTAWKPRKQLHRHETNIHWTVYTWLVDPFYRVIELFWEGERVLKAHLLPLIIRQRRVLAVDAIEVIPKLRPQARGKQVPHISQRLLARREEIVEGLFQTIRDLGCRMHVDAILVDKFSNAEWVRAVVDKLPLAIYGYLSDPQEPGKLIVDPEWASIIKTHFFDAFEDLGSSGATQRHLRQVGIYMPTRKSRSGRTRGGRPFTKQQVTRILRNPLYVGTVQWGDSRQDNAHEAIIDKAQFNRVQRKLDETRRTNHNHRYARGRTYPLKGLVRCGCGAMLTPKSATTRGQIYHYYSCTRQNHLGTGVGCKAPMIPAEALEQAVMDRIINLGTHDEDRGKVVKAAMAAVESETRKLDSDAEVIRHRLTTVQTEIANLLGVLKRLGAGAVASVQDELAKLEEERSQLQDRLQVHVEQSAPKAAGAAEAAEQFIRTWTSVGELLEQATPDERRVILQHYVEVVEITFDDPDGKMGKYALRLFPEVRPLDIPPSGNRNGTPKGGSVLTEDRIVCQSDKKAPRVGPEHVTNSSGKTQFVSERDANSDALWSDSIPADSDLAIIVRRWPALPESVRQQVLVLVRSAGDGE